MPINYNQVAGDRLLKRPAGYKYPNPQNPDEEEDPLKLKPVAMPQEAGQIPEIPQVPKAQPYQQMQKASAAPAPSALGAGSQALGAAPGASPAPPPAPAPVPDTSGTNGMGDPNNPHPAPDTSGTKKTPAFSAVPAVDSSGNSKSVVENPSTPDSEANKALQDIAKADQQGQPITDLTNAETQTAADQLARQQDQMNARMGGTGNPYSMLGGVAAQQAYLQRLGDINKQKVDLWMQNNQNAVAVWERLEAWNRENKPDIFAQYNPKFEAAFGAGYHIGPDGSVTNAKGDPITLTAQQKQMITEYMAANGAAPGSAAANAQSDVTTAAADKELTTKLDGMDPDVNGGWDGGHGGAIKAQVQAWLKANPGKVPTNRQIRDIYDSVGEGLPDSWPNRNNEENDDFLDRPAW